MKIYFDGVLLDEDNYMEFTYDKKQFENEFFLGSTSSIKASLTIPSDAFTTAPSEVVVKINNVDYLHLVIDSIEETDNADIRLNLTDKLINTDVPYDISSLVPITAKNLLNAICTEFSIPHDTFYFTNQNVTIDSYDNTITAREYIGMIAELSGGYAKINNLGKLEIKTYNNSPTNGFTYDDVDTFKLGDEIEIERITYEFAARKYESSNDDTLYTIVLNPNNLFLQVATDSQLTALAENIIGFTFNNIKIDTSNMFYNNDEVIYFNNGTSNCKILNQYNTSYGGDFVGSYETNINNTKQEFTKVLTPDEKIRSIKQTIAEDQLTITATRDDVSKLEATVNADGVLLSVLAFNSNIDVEYDGETPISGTVQEVTTTNNLQFNSSGLLLFDDGSDYIAQHTPQGTLYRDGNSILGRYTKDGSDLKNLGLYGIYSYGKEQIDEQALFVAQKYTHNINGVSTPGFGHFYNGGDIN